MATRVAVQLGMERAYSFLRREYDAHGWWEDFPSHRFGTGLDWITGYVGYQLRTEPSSAKVLRKAGSLLLSRQRDSAWGFSHGYFTDADSTSFCSMLLMSQGLLTDSHGQRVIDFLLAHQQPDGGFATFRDEQLLRTDTRIRVPSFEGWCSSHNSVTAAAIKALTTLGISWHDSVIVRALDFLRARQDEDGLWTDYWWQGPYYSTYHATDVLMHSPEGLPDRVLEKTCKTIVERQDPAGFWSCREDNAPCGFSTGLALNTLLLSPSSGFQDAIQAGIDWVNIAQREDGAWTSPPILQIPLPNVLNPDPLTVNREPEANFVFSTSTVYSALYNYNRWHNAEQQARADKRQARTSTRLNSIQPSEILPPPNAKTPRHRSLTRRSGRV